MPRKTKKPVSYVPQPERINPLDGLVMEDPVAAVSDRRVETTDDRRSETAATEDTAAVASSCAIPRSAIRNPHSLTPAYRDDAHGIWLYHGNYLAILDAIAAKHPDGCFDAIFADPPYFLSNGGITCHAGRMVKVDKGDWDKPSEARRSAEGDPQGRAESDERVQSRGAEENHNFNREWLRRCQRGFESLTVLGLSPLPASFLPSTILHHTLFAGCARKQRRTFYEHEEVHGSQLH